MDIPLQKEDLLEADNMVEIPVDESSDNYVDISIPPSPQKAKENLLGPQIDQAFVVQESKDLLFAETLQNPLNLQRKKSPIMPFQSHTGSCLNSDNKVPVQIP